MSFYLYDEALVEEFRKVVDDERIYIVPPESSLSFLAKINKDEVKFPAVLLTRGPTVINTAIYNQVAALRGQPARINRDNEVVNMRLIPLRIDWTVNVYAVDRFSCDEIVRELVFYLISCPRLEVKVPYGVDLRQNFDVFISPEIVDNSDLVQFSNLGDYYRETLSIYTENAYLFMSSKHYPSRIEKRVVLDKDLTSNH